MLFVHNLVGFHWVPTAHRQMLRPTQRNPLWIPLENHPLEGKWWDPKTGTSHAVRSPSCIYTRTCRGFPVRPMIGVRCFENQLWKYGSSLTSLVVSHSFLRLEHPKMEGSDCKYMIWECLQPLHEETITPNKSLTLTHTVQLLWGQLQWTGKHSLINPKGADAPRACRIRRYSALNHLVWKSPKVPIIQPHSAVIVSQLVQVNRTMQQTIIQNKTISYQLVPRLPIEGQGHTIRVPGSKAT